MSRIQGNPLLIDMVLPGSHDAGVYGQSLTSAGAPRRYTRCQGSNIYNQALHGSRVFDCRVFLQRVKQDGRKTLQPAMGHFGLEKFKWPVVGESTGGLGGYGGSLITAVKDAIAFVKTYDSEFLILRFSHTYCPDEVGTALAELMQVPGNGKYIFTQSSNIALCNLSALKGKVIMVFASEFHTNFKITDGYLPFYKHEAGQPAPVGLTCCGIYKGTKSMGKVTTAAATAADAHSNHPRDHLHWVYWQQTMTTKIPLFGKEVVTGLGNVEEKTKGAGGAHAKLDDFLNDVKKQMGANKWRLPNVIGHDFVTAETCKKIFELNPHYR
jgi:hypothetical protein